MSRFPDFKINTNWILANRGSKNPVDQNVPYAFLVEKERTLDGEIEDVGTIFLTNNECPYKCLMCDLWKNTTDKPLESGVVPKQIEYALERMPSVKHLKLYNSGNFFDKNAIPHEDFQIIAAQLEEFETVIVENHPNMINQKCLEFNVMLKPNLHIALGLETVHPDILPRLNKKLSLDAFSKSVEYLINNNIPVRAFILLRPPFLSEDEGLHWAKESINFAFDCGVECCTIIPTRAGNGAMDVLQNEGFFEPPTINSFEEVLEYGIRLNKGRIFADLWDIELFSNCEDCIGSRKLRMMEMNHHQKIVSTVECTSCLDKITI